MFVFFAIIAITARIVLAITSPSLLILLILSFVGVIGWNIFFTVFAIGIIACVTFLVARAIAQTIKSN